MELKYNFSTRKKGKGWQLVMDYKDSTGWHQKTKAGFNTKSEALAYRKTLLKKVESLAAVDSTLKDITFRQFVELYLKTRTLQFNTLISYRGLVNSVPDFADKPMKDIKYIDVVSQMNTVNVQDSTRRSRQVMLKSLFKAAVDLHVIAENPIAKMKYAPKSKEPKRLRTFTQDEIQIYLDQGATSQVNVLVCICALTGLRAGEVLGLQWADVDLVNAEIHVNKQYKAIGKDTYGFGTVKNAHGNRTLHIPPTLCKILAEYKRGAVLYMDGRLTNLRNPGALNRYVARMTPGHSPHDFRHTFATTMLAKGVDVRTVAALLGDTVLTVEATYLHYTQDMRHAASKVIDMVYG